MALYLLVERQSKVPDAEALLTIDAIDTDIALAKQRARAKGTVRKPLVSQEVG
jgi:hypothetical protein